MGIRAFLTQAYIFLAAVVCDLRRIQSSRYEIGLQMSGAAAVETSYKSLVYTFPRPTAAMLILLTAYET